MDASVQASRSYVDYLRLFIVAVLGASLVFLVVHTWRWPLTWDAQVLHYINFLIDRGFKPYIDITDMNMPGAYVLDWLQMHILGPGDLAWRIYDFALVGAIVASLIVIAIPYDWVAGLFAGTIFALIHGMDGPPNLGQRDEIMAALIVVGYAFLLSALRKRRPWLMLPFGLSLAMATAVKPTVAPLAFALLLFAFLTLRKRNETSIRYLAFGIAGAAISSAVVLGFLMHFGAVSAFLEITRTLTPYYMGLANSSLVSLLPTMVQRGVELMVLLAIAVAFFNREWIGWERWALLMGAAFGIFTYLIQHKGFVYHRYTLTPFLLVWLGIELMLAMKKHGWVKWVGVAGMILGGIVVPPWDARRILSDHWQETYTHAIEQDLTTLGGDQLQRKVQCLDLVDGCLNALYHLKLVQSTGSTGDLLLFATSHKPAQAFYQQVFMDELAQHPASVIVLSDEWFTGRDTFDKIYQWPAFADYLNANYDIAVTRVFKKPHPESYRVYVRKGANLPPLTQ